MSFALYRQQRLLAASSAVVAVAAKHLAAHAKVSSTAHFWTPGYEPNAKQVLLHTSTARHVLYGGAAGGGKSRAFREHAYDLCQRYAGITVGLFRRTYPELRDTHVIKLQQEWPHKSYKFNKSDHTIHFANGSVLILGHCQYVSDIPKYLGTEYDFLFFDELTTFYEEMYDQLCARLRTTRRDLIPQAIAATNPGGVGHGWVKARWIDRVAEDRIDLAQYTFIPARLDDNPHINAEYRRTLEALPEQRREALLNGRWDVFEGQYFREWDPQLHVIDPTHLPSAWARGRAVDYGSTNPFCCLWAAVDTAHRPARVYVYREHYKSGSNLRANAERVVSLSDGERYRWSMGDPSMAARNQEQSDSRTSLLQQAQGYGLTLSPAYNDRVAGWNIVRDYLLPRADGLPGLFIFRTCHNLIRTLPLMVHDARNVEDLDSTTEDHAADALRYLLCAIDGRGTGTKQAGIAGSDTRQMAAASGYGRGM